jgi:hypothetical protein
VIVFQKGNHVDCTGTLENWKDPFSWHGNEVHIIHVASKLEAGYYGRFLSPLAVDTTLDANFIVLDDDIIFGIEWIFGYKKRAVRERGVQ